MPRKRIIPRQPFGDGSITYEWAVSAVGGSRRKRVIPRQVNGYPLTGEALKQLGMAQAVDAVPDWSPLAKHVWTHDLLLDARRTGEPVQSEDLTAVVGLPRKVPGQHRNNAVGGIIGGAGRRGLGMKVGKINAGRPISHANDRDLWIGTGKVLSPANSKSAKPCPYCGGYI